MLSRSPRLLGAGVVLCKKDVTDERDGETYFHAACYNNKEKDERERKGERGRRV
jgi:hypothetical protein